MAPHPGVLGQPDRPRPPRRSRPGGHHPRRSADSRPDPFFVPVAEVGAHGADYVSLSDRINETEETPCHPCMEEKLDRLVEGPSASDQDLGGTRFILHLLEP